MGALHVHNANGVKTAIATASWILGELMLASFIFKIRIQSLARIMYLCDIVW